MVKHFSKVRKQGMNFQLPAIYKICQRRLAVPDATSLHHCLQNHRQYFTILSWIQALDTRRPVAILGKGDFLGIAISFLSSKCSDFPLPLEAVMLGCSIRR